MTPADEARIIAFVERLELELEAADQRIAALERLNFAPEPEWVTCREAARLLPGSKSTVLRLARAGLIEGRKMDKVGTIIRTSTITKYRDENSASMSVVVTEGATA